MAGGARPRYGLRLFLVLAVAAGIGFVWAWLESGRTISDLINVFSGPKPAEKPAEKPVRGEAQAGAAQAGAGPAAAAQARAAEA